MRCSNLAAVDTLTKSITPTVFDLCHSVDGPGGGGEALIELSLNFYSNQSTRFNWLEGTKRKESIKNFIC